METAPRKTRVWVRILRSALVVLAVPFVLLYVFQNRLLFYPEARLPSPPEGVEEVTFKAADGTKLVSWFLPPKKGKPTILFFHGNAGNAYHREYHFSYTREWGWGILILGYRGYGKSEGSPDEEGLYQDSRAALAWLRARPEVDAKKLVYYGESMGCAPAFELAVAEPPAALVVEAPWRSLKAIADVVYPWLPTRILLRSTYDNESQARNLKCPAFVAHGKRDEVIPFEQGQAVYAAIPTEKQFYELNSHHNDIPDYGGDAYRRAVREFVEKATR